MKIPGNISASICGCLLAGAIAVPAQVVKDACAMVTVDEVSAALGEPVEAGIQQAPPNGEKFRFSSTCFFKATQTAHRIASVGVVYLPGDLAGSMDRMPMALKAVGMKNVHMVDGVGDGAIWASYAAPRQGGELLVRKGNVQVIVNLEGLADEGMAIDRAKMLVGKVLPRI